MRSADSSPTIDGEYSRGPAASQHIMNPGEEYPRGEQQQARYHSPQYERKDDVGEAPHDRAYGSIISSATFVSGMLSTHLLLLLMA